MSGAVPEQAVSVFQQNMALLPSLRLPNGKDLYLGREREAVLDSLAAFLHHQQPDLVGLSELFVLEERRALVEQVAHIYPHFLEGPGETSNYNVDGGLLMLSRFKILTQGSMVYNACLGEDCLANKGVLYGRIQLSKETETLDLFLTHLQNPTPMMAGPDMGPGTGGAGKLQVQLDVLADFVERNRDPNRPALLMGDLNIDANVPASYEQLLARLGRPDDLWPSTAGSELPASQRLTQPLPPTNGVTFDSQSTFARNDLTGFDPAARHRSGKRLDYFLSYPGVWWVPRYQETRIIRLESSPGRDISDHYGLMTELAELLPPG